MMRKFGSLSVLLAVLLLAFTWACGGGGGGGGKPAIYGTFAVTASGNNPFAELWTPDAKWIRFDDNEYFHILRENSYGFRAVHSGVFVATKEQVNMDGTLYNYEVNGTTLTLTAPSESYVIARDAATPELLVWAPPVTEVSSFPFQDDYTYSTDIAFDGTNLWVGNAYSSTSLSIVNPTTGEATRTLKTGNYAWGIGWDGANLWVGSNGYDRITEIDMATGANLTTSPPLGAWIYGVAYDGVDLWAYSSNERSLYRFFPGDVAVAETILLDEFAYGNGGGLEFANGSLYMVAGDMVHRCTTSPFLAVQSWRVNGMNLSGIAYDGTSFWLLGSVESDFQTRLLIRAHLP